MASECCRPKWVDPSVVAGFKFGGGEKDFTGVELIFEGRKKGVSRSIEIYAGEEDFSATREERGVEFGTTDEVEIFPLRWGGNFLEGAKNLHAGDFRLAGENPIFAAREGFSDRVLGLAAHEDDMAERGAFEKFQILGEMPRNAALEANRAVPGHRDNGDHIEIGALMAGWGS